MTVSTTSPTAEILSPTTSGATTFTTSPVTLNGNATSVPTPHPVSIKLKPIDKKITLKTFTINLLFSFVQLYLIFLSKI